MADGAAQAVNSHRGQRGFACEPCCRRKVRCDRLTPCANCRRRKEQCSYSMSGEEYTQRHARHEELKRQRELKQQRKTAAQTPGPPATPRHHATPSTGLLSDPLALLFSSTASSMSDSEFNSSHPSPDATRSLWYIYLDRVHPILGIWPAWKLRESCDHTISDLDSLSSIQHGFAFAIYAFAVLTLSEDECSSLLGLGRVAALARFQALTERALHAARLLDSSDVFVLHVFFMYLHVQSYRIDMGAVWALVGMLVRLAQVHDLHKDPQSLGRDPWDTEYRRRLWWQLQKLNQRVSELFGREGAACDFSWDTKLPIGINDEQFRPGMLTSDEKGLIPDDWMIVKLRFELLHWEHQHQMSTGSNPLVWMKDPRAPFHEKEVVIENLERHLQSTYLRYCDPLKPHHFFASIIGRGAISVMRLFANHSHIKSRGGPAGLQHEQHYLAQLARKTLEYHVLTANSPMLTRFKWHASWQFQWYCLLILVSDLKDQRDIQEKETGWKLITDIFEMYPFMSFEIERPIHAAIGDLLLRAWKTSHTLATAEPSFVRKLRAEREKYTEASKGASSLEGLARSARAPSQGSLGPEAQGSIEDVRPSAESEVHASSTTQGGLWGNEGTYVGNIWDHLPLDEFQLQDFGFLNDPAFAPA